MPILTTAKKNLIDITKIVSDNPSITIDYIKPENGEIQYRKDPSMGSANGFVKVWVKVKPNTDYKLYYDYNNMGNVWIYTDATFGNAIVSSTSRPQFNSGANEYLLIGFYSPSTVGGHNTLTNIQLEVGTVATAFEPYTELPSNNTLRETTVGKVSGSIVENPHSVKGRISSVISNPNVSATEFTTAQYKELEARNGIWKNTFNNTNGQMAQHEFSFNILASLEKTYGRDIWQGKEAIADKIIIANNLITNLIFRWHGMGSSVGGSKATVRHWSTPSGGTWQHDLETTTSPSVVMIDITPYDSGNPTWAIDIANCITADGFVHFLAHADASDGVTGSNISTDYVELEIKTFVGSVKKQWQNTFAGKLGTSLFENPHIAERMYGATLQSPSAFTTESDTARYNTIKVLDGNLDIMSNTVSTMMSQQLFSFNVVEMLERRYGHGIWQGKILLADKVAIAKKVVTRADFAWHGFGTSVGGNSATVANWNGTTWVDPIVHANGNVTQLTRAYLNVARIDANGYLHFIAYTTNASDGVVPAAINTDYVQLDLKTVYDTLTSKPINNFVGKVAYVNTENPHRFTSNWMQGSTVLEVPTSSKLNEESQSSYNKAMILDGTVVSCQNTVNGSMSQQMFRFNIIEMIERKYGTAIWEGASTLAEKIAKAKTIITDFNFVWHGYGSSVGGNKATTKVWRVGDGTYVGGASTTNGTVTKVTTGWAWVAGSIANFLLSYMDANGMVHVVMHSEASDGVTPSNIYTDYVEVQLTVASPSVGAFTQHLRNCYPNYNVGGVYPDSRSAVDNMRIVFYGVASSKTGIEAHPEVDLQPFQLQNRWWKELTNPNPIV